ncbi:MAG: DNA polymerase III subunit beta [Christensenellales bacterium]|jgi:DNA polymerase-3 subunit beta
MRFTTTVQELTEGLSMVMRALSSRTTNPILDGILIEAGEDYVQITCSDERITIITRVRADVDEPGRGVAPGKLFTELVRRMPMGDLLITMNDSFQFKLSCMASRMNLSGQDADLYPLPSIVGGELEITLPQSMLKDMIAKTEFAIAQEDMRDVLTGAFLEVRGGDAVMVALDGFRLAMIKNACSEITGAMSAIIPGRAVGDIGRLLKDGPEDFCTLTFEKNRLHIDLAGTDIYVVLIEGEYVDYRKILPTQFNTRVIAELEPLRRAIDRAALIAREGNNNLIRFRAEDGRLYIESNSEIGDVHEEMDIEMDGADITITFNVKYMLDIVRTIESERIEISLNTAITPCVITPVDNRDYLHLVLPVRTRA